MDKRLADEYVSKVSPLEHSDNPHDRAKARKYESKLRKINREIPEPEGKQIKKVRKT